MCNNCINNLINDNNNNDNNFDNIKIKNPLLRKDFLRVLFFTLNV